MMKLGILCTLTMICMFITEFVVAQPMLPIAPPQAPIDGGLSLLAAAGLGAHTPLKSFGIRRSIVMVISNA